MDYLKSNFIRSRPPLIMVRRPFTPRPLDNTEEGYCVFHTLYDAYTRILTILDLLVVVQDSSLFFDGNCINIIVLCRQSWKLCVKAVISVR
jgi:hypothetical protein